MPVSVPARNASLYTRNDVEGASPLRLVVVLYDGALRFLAAAREGLETGNLEVRHVNLLKAQRILSELMSSLDLEQGGEVARNLQRLYLYMLEQLVEANLNDTAEPIERVIVMLRDLREGWAELNRRQNAHDFGAELPEAA